MPEQNNSFQFRVINASADPEIEQRIISIAAQLQELSLRKQDMGAQIVSDGFFRGLGSDGYELYGALRFVHERLKQAFDEKTLALLGKDLAKRESFFDNLMGEDLRHFNGRPVWNEKSVRQAVIDLLSHSVERRHDYESAPMAGTAPGWGVSSFACNTIGGLIKNTARSLEPYIATPDSPLHPEQRKRITASLMRAFPDVAFEPVAAAHVTAG